MEMTSESRPSYFLVGLLLFVVWIVLEASWARMEPGAAWRDELRGPSGRSAFGPVAMRRGLPTCALHLERTTHAPLRNRPKRGAGVAKEGHDPSTSRL